jgi:perosamine synthetase
MGWQVPVARPDLGEAEAEAVAAVVRSGWISQGPRVRDLEDAFRRLTGAPHAVATSSGTGALHTVLLALGLGRGDQVITSPLSCIASVNPILFQGAEPVFVDVEPRTYNLDVARVEARITPRTRVILPVHLFGHPVDMDPLLEIGARHGIPVVEDACQAMGAQYRGRPVGNLGHAGYFSLYTNKTATAGEGGMVVTGDADLYHRMQAVRNLGQLPGEHFVHALLGANYKLTDLQAAIGVIQMGKLSESLSRRRQNVAMLNRALAGLTECIEQFPQEEAYATVAPFSYHMLFRTVVIKQRAEQALHAAGVETRPFFSLASAEAPYRALGYEPEDTPVAADALRRGLYVSCSPDLDERDRGIIVEALRGMESQ